MAFTDDDIRKMIVSKRICPGVYRVTDGSNTVCVERLDFGYGDEWVAQAEDIPLVGSDPLPTYRDAKQAAIEILAEWEELRKV